MQKRQSLTRVEREFIELWVRTGRSYRFMGRQLKRDHTVILREVHRNSGEQLWYTAAGAERIRDRRRHKQRRRKIDHHPELKAYIVNKLVHERWSPQDIAGRLKTHQDCYFKISHESIYDWIYTGNGQYEGLYHYLHYKQSKRTPRYTRKTQKQSRITGRISIHERPKIVDTKQRFGDWETDTMVFSKQKPCLSVHYERKSKLVRIHRMNNRSADETLRAITSSIESLSQGHFETITFDNGLEGAQHKDLRATHGVNTFFCDPYASWQKGGVENMNKWIRRFFPRSTEMNDLSQNDILAVQELLNNKPRKSLDFFTPNEVLQQWSTSGA